MQPIWQTGLSNSRGATRRAAGWVTVDPAQHGAQAALLLIAPAVGTRPQETRVAIVNRPSDRPAQCQPPPECRIGNETGSLCSPVSESTGCRRSRGTL